ncbi:fatty acid desaturase [Rhizobium sp. BK379]|uniref:fatty acid desaturase n=1 Tax=Rhizobium sp. BK379 TaxID=2587059 RepID=UPI0017E1C1CA|nr:fatty acid desaturase [Rhizobium sp. BK379]MBB3444430.1 omega-6 fatty acid desaturase (delta-12 desaturase) [Rhizobium sp. BK379]
MTSIKPPASPGADPESAWLKIIAGYRKPVLARSLYELAVTLIPFVLLWATAAIALQFGYWIGLLLIIPAAGFLLRIFMLQHDCGHGSFFGKRRLDDWTGRVLGILTLTPYDYWRRAHNEHHASAGNLDERGVGDITTLTVSEYRNLTPMGQLGYRLYRNPFVMFGIGPAFLFLLKQRLPFGMMRSGALPWVSTMATNVAVTVLTALLIWSVGIIPFLLIHLSIVLIAGSAGVWLFYVQHQFEDTHWSRPPDWAFPYAAMHGASHYDLPRPLRWMSGNIGMHQIHHLSSRVPFYRLPEVLRDHPELADVGRISIRDSLACVKFVLWDEKRQRLISFEEMEMSV